MRALLYAMYVLALLRAPTSMRTKSSNLFTFVVSMAQL